MAAVKRCNVSRLKKPALIALAVAVPFVVQFVLVGVVVLMNGPSLRRLVWQSSFVISELTGLVLLVRAIRVWAVGAALIYLPAMFCGLWWYSFILVVWMTGDSL